MQVLLFCTTGELAERVDHVFPLRPGDCRNGITYHPCPDDTTPFCVEVSLTHPVLSLRQRASLLGGCTWYTYRVAPMLLRRGVGRLESVDTFATWLAFQEDSPDRRWDAVLQDYARALSASRQEADRWLYGHEQTEHQVSATLPPWLLTFSTLLAPMREADRTLTKVLLQQLLETACEQDMKDYQYYVA